MLIFVEHSPPFLYVCAQIAQGGKTVRLYFSALPAFALALVLNANSAQACDIKTPIDLASENCARAVQDSLIWTGDYSGMVDGETGAGTLRAIKAFKVRHKLAPDEPLSAPEFTRLIALASKAKTEVGFEAVNLSELGVTLGIPKKLVGNAREETWGASWQNRKGTLVLGALRFDDGRGLDEIFEAMRQVPGRAVAYERKMADWFVLSGDDGGGKEFYVRLQGAAPPYLGFSVTFSKALADSYRPLVIAMAASFSTGPESTPAAADESVPEEARRPFDPYQGLPRPSIPDPCGDQRVPGLCNGGADY